MSISILRSKRRLRGNNYEGKNCKKLYNSTENIDDSFESLCQQKSIDYEKFLQAYGHVVVTGKHLFYLKYYAISV